MALPNNNISVAMVKSELGAATNDVGQLCIHPNINKWSKWKPVAISNLVDPATIEDLAGAQYGLAIPFFSTRAELISYYNSNNGEWTYTKPSGGMMSPYRLSDFRNYEHSASIFYNVIIPSQQIGGGGVPIQLTHFAISGGLTWSDFLENINNLHFGATASNGQTVVESEPITADNVGYVTIPTTTNITIYAFLAEVSPVDPSNILRYYALEGGKGDTNYLSTGLTVTMVNNMISGSNRVYAEFTITNTAPGSSVPVNSISVQVRYGDKLPTDGLETGEATFNFGNITVVNGAPQTRSNTFNNVLYDYSLRGGYVYFQCTSHPQLNGMYPINVMSI
jgi:hypothetical protein